MGPAAARILAVALAAASSAVETMIDAPGPAGPLKGSLLRPGEAASPVALIIPGSGPTDRDGNNPLGVAASSYRLLAQGLAARGISSVRIDKRGMFASAAAAPDPNAVTIADYADDVRAWIGAIRVRTGATCVWLLGHSEGGLVALASSDGPGVCGLILVAAPGRPMGDILKAQLYANPANAPLLPDAVAAIDSLAGGKTVDPSAFHPALKNLFPPEIQKFLISAFSYDPAQLVKGCRKPVLILQGESDLQVGSDDARRLAAANPAAKLILLPGVNHVLKAVPADDRGANLAAYADPHLPLAPGIVEAIAGFVRAAARMR